MERISKDIDSKLATVAQSWYERAKNVDESIEREREILLSDAAKTDRSENAVYQIASDNYARLQVIKRDIMNKIDAYEHYQTEYVPSEYIAIGSTVKLELRETGDIIYVKLVPADLGCARIGAITAQSPVGKAILGKYAGDTIRVITRRGELEYAIKEVF